MGIDPLSLAIGAAIFLVATIVAYSAYKPNIQQPGVKASGLDDFNITRASEGSPYPIVFGKVKISGNIVWYGNLKTSRQKTDSGGKGGGGGEETTTGFHYYLDCWQTVCRGPARILGMYKENKQFITTEINPTWSGVMADEGDGRKTTTITVNKGNGVSNFTISSLEYFAPLPKVCSVYLKKTFCGSGTSYPSFHFVVQCDYPIMWNNPSNGWNPANAIYFMLTDAGVNPVDIDNNSFSSSATYWYNKSYGINLVIGSQGKLREKVQNILSPLGGFYIEAGGKHYLSPADPYEAAYGSVVDDFRKFVISRRSWEDTVNDLKATFTEEGKDFTERTAVVQNPASINMLGKVYTKTYDLTLFRDLATTQKRMGELIKNESYPYAEVEFTTDLAYMNVTEGNILNLTKTDLGIYDMSVRVVKKNLENIDSNEIIFHGVQVAETLFDDKWVNIGTGSSNWVREVQQPINLTKLRIIEVPRTSLTDMPTIMVLAAQETGYEVEFLLYYTPDGNNYVLVKRFSAFSLYATLKAAYSGTTYDIDDSDTGILIQYYKDEYEVDSLSRSGLFSTDRFLIIDNEIMKFQTVTLNGDGTVKLTGIIRGVLNTAKAAHSLNAAVWIVDDPSCIWTPSDGNIAGYYKVCARNLVGTFPIASASAINFGASSLAQKPFSISRVNGLRSGSTVTFVVYVRDMTPAGAGVSPSSSFYTNSDTDVVIEWKLSTDSVWTVLPVQTATFTVTNASGFTVNVRAKEFGIYSSTVNLVVSTTDGNYTV
jgi:hypothetical protein